MTELSHFLTIGEVAARSGVATSALRFYEEQGLISSERTSGNQRRYRRAVLRRVAVIRQPRRSAYLCGKSAQHWMRFPTDARRTKRTGPACRGVGGISSQSGSRCWRS